MTTRNMAEMVIAVIILLHTACGSPAGDPSGTTPGSDQITLSEYAEITVEINLTDYEALMTSSIEKEKFYFFGSYFQNLPKTHPEHRDCVNPNDENCLVDYTQAVTNNGINAAFKVKLGKWQNIAFVYNKIPRADNIKMNETELNICPQLNDDYGYPRAAFMANRNENNEIVVHTNDTCTATPYRIKAVIIGLSKTRDVYFNSSRIANPNSVEGMEYDATWTGELIIPGQIYQGAYTRDLVVYDVMTFNVTAYANSIDWAAPPGSIEPIVYGFYLKVYDMDWNWQCTSEVVHWVDILPGNDFWYVSPIQGIDEEGCPIQLPDNREINIQ